MANNIPNSELNDLVTKVELLRIMECPVCQEIPFPPIYLCIRGHNICQYCKPKLKECPTCRGSLSDTRNYTVEKMVLASKHWCCYKEDGCHFELAGDLMETHMKTCSFRPFKCPWVGDSKCSTNSLRLVQAKDHFLKVHFGSILPFVGPTATFNRYVPFKDLTGQGSGRRLKSNLTWAPYPVEFDGNMFIVYTFTMDQTICFMVVLIGSKEEARKYYVKIICQPEKEREIQWTSPVEPVIMAAEMMNPQARHNFFVSSCSLKDLIQMAEEDLEEEPKYKFSTRYILFK